MYIYSYIHTRITMYKPRKDYSLNLRGLGKERCHIQKIFCIAIKAFLTKVRAEWSMNLHRISNRAVPKRLQCRTNKRKMLREALVRPVSVYVGLELAVENPLTSTLWSLEARSWDMKVNSVDFGISLTWRYQSCTQSY